MKKTDLRVLRTRKMIIEAFVKLLKTKDFENITIQDIADEAMINRATFYAHFHDKHDLYEQILGFTMEAFTNILNTEQLVTHNAVKLKEIEKTLTKVFKIIKENQHIFLILVDNSSSLNFHSKLTELLQEQYADIFKKLRITENDIDVPVDFIVQYMTSIFMSTVFWWIKSDYSFPPNHLARLIIKLVGNGHLTVLGIEIED